MKKYIKGLVLGVLITTILMSTAVGASIKKTIEVAYNSVNLTVNGEKVVADNILYKGTTYVPLRAVAEALGKDVGWEQETKTASINDKKVEGKKAGYGVDEWWEVKDQWKLKIDSVSFTDERNQFSDKYPEAVVVIKYSYENLGYEGRIQDLYINPDNVADGDKKIASTYPAGANVNARPTPIGAIMEGAEVSYGLSSDKGEITIYFDEYDDDSTRQKAYFVIPLPEFK